MKLFIADYGRDFTTIHCVDVNKGKYQPPKRTKGSFKEQTNQLLQLVLKHRPEKLIFDNIGFGAGLKEQFDLLLKEMNMSINKDGTLIYS